MNNIKPQINLFSWFLFLQLFTSAIANAQGITLSGPATGEYSSTTSITLLPGFSTSGPFHAYITGMLTIPLASTPSQDQNYLRIKTYKIPSAAEIASPLVSQQSEVIQYFDGLGRQLQTVQTEGSPLGNDIVQPFVYDLLGREAIKYLPYAEQIGNGAYKPAAISTQAQYYGTSGWDASVVKTAAPYSQTLFESSPLNRILEQGASGVVWQPASQRSNTAGRTMLMSNQSNDITASYATGFSVQIWNVNSVPGVGYKNRLTNGGVYAAGQLYLKITKDENWTAADGKLGTTEEYTDKEGHLILKRTFFGQSNGVNAASTYYVYDDLGNLSFVLPPGAGADATFISQTNLDLFCYQYRYDSKNRLIEKKIPGKGWEYLVYNQLDQPVLSQDSVQRNNGQWAFNKYDGLGRIVETGLYVNSSARTTMEATLNAETIFFEKPITTGLGYTSVSYPQSAGSYLTIQYYDDYNFPGATSYAYTGSLKTKGLQTGGLINVLGTGNMLLNVNYYDDYGRILKTYKQHYQSGMVVAGNYDEISDSYNFEGELASSTRIHHNSSSGNTIIATRYDYDHVGRKLRTYEQINADAEVMLAENTYNEIGQVKTKALNGGMQNTSFSYNERGWLKNSTSTEFSFQLNYQDGTTPQFNGNISGQLWGAGNTFGNTFSYNYDKINRLTSGVATGMSEVLTYDAAGNIMTLNRDGALNNYTYTGNQLGSTTSTGNYRYDGNGNTVIDGRLNQAIVYNILNLPAAIAGLNLSYLYDASGDKLRKTVGTNVTDYIAGIQYTNGSIDFIQTDAGLARRNGTSYSYEYNLTDHLGNVRFTFHKSPVTGAIERLQSDDYYPFGLRKSVGTVSSNDNKYLYNGKELQDELGQYDYGARFYDPVIGRWSVVDPMAEQDRRWSPYVYGFNNPIRFEDPDGMWPGEGFFGNLYSSAKKSFSGYFNSAYNAARHPINTAKGIANNISKMSAGELITYPITNSPGVRLLKTEAAAIHAIVKGDGKALGSIIGNEAANTATVLATAGLGEVIGKGVGALRGIEINNPVPGTLARVVPIGETAPTSLGRPGSPDVFVTAASDIQGLNSAQISERLTIPESSTGFHVFEFPTPRGISTPINRTDPGFVGFGRTAGGAREFSIPNQSIPANTVRKTITQ